jgi:hypothetical protein
MREDMCDLCEKAKSSEGYRALMARMQEEDSARLEASREAAKTLRPIERSV